MASNFSKDLIDSLAHQLTESRTQSEEAHENIVRKLSEDSKNSVIAFVNDKSPHTPKGAKKLVIKFDSFMLSKEGKMSAKVETYFEGCFHTYSSGTIVLFELPSAIMYNKMDNQLELDEWNYIYGSFDDCYLFVQDHPELQKIKFSELIGDTPTIEIPIGGANE